MSSLSDVIDAPSKDFINTGLDSAAEDTMIELLGRPGELTRECSDPFPEFRNRLAFGVDVGPFKVSGLKQAVESLEAIFGEVKVLRPDLFSQVRTAGMLCIRHKRNNPSQFSNHSWGAAIDLFFGDGVVPQGRRLTHRGNLDLYFFFHKHGWCWGAGFSGGSIDSMHFELAEETVRALFG